MTFEITRVDHIAVATWDVERLLPLWRDVMGLVFDGARSDEELGYTGTVYRVPGSGFGFEMLVPFNEESLIGRFLRHKGPGLHHLSLQVKDVAAAAAALRAAGIGPFGERDTESGPEFFIHPRRAGGLLVHVTRERDGLGAP